MSRVSRGKLVVVAVAALAFRLGFIAWEATGWHVLGLDELTRTYLYQGYALCAGWGYVRIPPAAHEEAVRLFSLAQQGRITPQVTPGPGGKLIRPEVLHVPGMAILVAGLHTLSGPATIPLLKLLGALLDTWAACLLYVTVAGFFKPRVGFAAGLLYAFYPPLGYSSGVLMAPDGLLSAFIIGCLYCVTRGASPDARRPFAWFALAGLVLGVGCYLRVDYLLVPVFMALPLLMITRRWWFSVAAVVLVQAIPVVLLTPWAWRNHELAGRWVFTSGEVGATLITGLGEYSNVWGFGGTDHDREREAIEAGFETAWCFPADDHFREVFFRSITSRPDGYLISVAKRTPMVLVAPQSFGFKNPLQKGRFSDGMRQGKDRFAQIMADPLYILRAYWDWLLMGVISVASLAASAVMVWCERRSPGPALLLLSPHLYSMVTHGLTHYEPRFVLPSMFGLLTGLAYVLVKGWKEPAASPAPESA